VKPLDGFPPSRQTRDGRSSWCRGCANAKTREWRDQNPERVAAYAVARRVAHGPRECVECGEDFTPNRSDRIVCSTSCRWARKRRLKREREAA
jgi:hypothetical protein